MASNTSKPNGWHDFSLNQAIEYIEELKVEYSKNTPWTGVFRCAEQMTELAAKQRKMIAKLQAELKATKAENQRFADLAARRHDELVDQRMQIALAADHLHGIVHG